MSLLTQLFENIQTNQTISHPFWIVHSDGRTWINNELTSHISHLLWDYITQDFLHCRDFSDDLGKQHSFKIEATNTETSKELEREYQYNDMGARELNDRLARSAMGTFKIVLIEHIERMTPAAANALLKSTEEPLPGRLLIGTSRNTWSVLDTLLSRALLIHNPRELGVRDSSNEKQFSTIQEYATTLTQSLHTPRLHSLYQFRQGVHKQWYTHILIDYLMEKHHTNPLMIWLYVAAKKKLQANVIVDAVLFDLALQQASVSSSS